MKKKLKNLSISLVLFFASFMFCFSLAEILTVLFYDESVNYDKYVKETIARQRTESNVFSQEKYVKSETGLKYYVQDDRLSDHYALFDQNEVNKEKDGKKYRIAIIGDSFTMGGGLPGFFNNENTYTKQLSKLLNKDTDDYEILVFAEGGVNTFQELVILREFILGYEPDMVILQYCDNDVGYNRSELGYTDSNLYINSKTDILFIDNHIVPAFYGLSRDANILLLKNSAFLRFVSFKLNIALLASSSNWQDNEKKSFDSLAEMKNILNNKNIPMIMINFPQAYAEFNACDDGAGQKDFHTRLKLKAEDLSIKYFNMCDYVSDIRLLKSKHSDDGGCHYGEEGYALAANILYKAVLKESKASISTDDLVVER